MTNFETNRVVNFTARQMYDLVADIAAYPQFLPLCEDLTIRSRAATADGELITATMTVGYKAIHERFTSRVALAPALLCVVATSDDGPFKHLENRWSFTDGPGGGCAIKFAVTYEFKSFMLQLLMGAMFDHAVRRFTDAFEARAVAVYGATGTG